MASPQRPINLIVPAPRSDYNHSVRLLKHLKPDVIEAYMRWVDAGRRGRAGGPIEEMKAKDGKGKGPGAYF